MPPGVEHSQYTGGRNLALELITVSMPPGVEHANYRQALEQGDYLITVSMPPGVEHIEDIDIADHYASDHRLDASGR